MKLSLLSTPSEERREESACSPFSPAALSPSSAALSTADTTSVLPVPPRPLTWGREVDH